MGLKTLLYADSNSDLKYARHLKRVLVLDSQAAPTRLLVNLLGDLGAQSVRTEITAKGALACAEAENPQIIFCEYSGKGWDGLDFARDVRRSEFACRKVPIIMVTTEATAQAILGARDAGVHEFLRKPYTIKDLIRRIEAVTLRSRDWVEAIDYVGPDRRRFNSGEYTGPRKRNSDSGAPPEQARIEQALKILKAAVEAVEREPNQALRAMRAQAVDLTKAAAAVSDASLAKAAGDLQKALNAAEGGPALTKAALRPLLAPLLSRLGAKGERAA